MGSTVPHLHAHWVILSALFGILFLIFDAFRSFVFQIGPVRLRRLETDEGHARWTQYDARNFQLVSGALLQIALLVAVGTTVMVFDEETFGMAVVYAVAIWALIVMA